MKERDVRAALYFTEINRLLALQPASLVIDELGLLQGTCRIDVAVIGNELHGYEIKSASDNLERLPAQQLMFSKVFDKMTLVVDERHVKSAVKLIPDWWGLIAVTRKETGPYLNELWPSRRNIHVDPYSVCQLLWRDEALETLMERGLDYGSRTKSRHHIWKKIARELTIEEIRKVVRHKLALRQMWRQRYEV